MLGKVNKKLGDTMYQFEVDGKDVIDVLSDMAQLSSMPDYCPLCKSSFCNLEMNKAKDDKGGEYTFVYVRCKKCNAKAQMGQYKSGGIYWKKFEKFEKGGTSYQGGLPEIQEDDILNESLN